MVRPAAARAWCSSREAARRGLASTTSGVLTVLESVVTCLSLPRSGGGGPRRRHEVGPSDLVDGAIDETVEEAHEPVDVREVRGDAERDPGGRHRAVVLPL